MRRKNGDDGRCGAVWLVPKPRNGGGGLQGRNQSRLCGLEPRTPLAPPPGHLLELPSALMAK